MRLRNRVKATRRLRGIKQNALAHMAGLSRTTLILIERDDGYEPMGAVMTRLATTLNDAGLFWWQPEGDEPGTVVGQAE